jgi:hypothetical protein
MSSEGFSALEKNAVICPERAVLPFLLGIPYSSLLQIVMAVWDTFFFNLNSLGRVWEPAV